MKHLKLIIIIIVALLFSIVLIERVCSSGETYIELRTAYEVEKKKVIEGKAAAEKEKRIKKEEIAKKDKEITAIKDKISAINEDRIELTRVDSERAKEIKKLKEERTILKSKDLIIANQDTLIKSWESRFWNERADKNKIIKQRDFWSTAYFKEHHNYLIEKEIRKSFEKQLAAQESLSSLGESIIVEGEKQVRGLSFRFSAANVLWTGVGIGIGYLIGGGVAWK